MNKCDAIKNDCGHIHHKFCYCNEKQGRNYTYNDEYGACAFCLGQFTIGQVICADRYNKLRVCPESF